MNVLNKEVEECCLCPCLDHLDMDGSPYCNMLQKDIKDCNIIHKDCPFNKPVTKEDFEKFGFKELSHSNIHLLKFKQGDFFTMYSPYNNHCVIEKGIINEMSTLPESLVVYIGTINNPVELEFILRSVGAIESK